MLRSRTEELSSALVESNNCLEEHKKNTEDLLCTRDEELMKLQNEIIARRRTEAEHKLELQQRLRAFEEDNARAKRAAEVASSGRDDALKEVEELQKLLSRSQNALSSLDPVSVRPNSFLMERQARLERARMKVELQARSMHAVAPLPAEMHRPPSVPPPASSQGSAETHRPPSILPVENVAPVEPKLGTATGARASHHGEEHEPPAEAASEPKTPQRDAPACEPSDPSTAPRQDPPTGSTPAAPPSKDPLPMTTPAREFPGTSIEIRPPLSFLASPVGSVLTDADFHASRKDAEAALSGVSTKHEVEGEQVKARNASDSSGTVSKGSTVEHGGGEMVAQSSQDSHGANVKRSSPTIDDKEDDILAALPESPSECYTSFDRDYDDDEEDEEDAEGKDKRSEQHEVAGNAIDSADSKTAAEDKSTPGDNYTTDTSVYQSDFETIVTSSTGAK